MIYRLNLTHWLPCLCEDCVVVVVLCGCVSSLFSVCALCVVCGRGRGWLLLMRTRHTCTQSTLIIISISIWASQHFGARLFRRPWYSVRRSLVLFMPFGFLLTICLPRLRTLVCLTARIKLPAVLPACYLLPATCLLPASFLPLQPTATCPANKQFLYHTIHSPCLLWGPICTIP